MLWVIFLTVALIAFLKLPSFRKAILVLVSTLGLLIVSYLAYEKYQTEAGSIPAGQVRDIGASIYFSGNTKPQGKFEWNYTIAEVRARN